MPGLLADMRKTALGAGGLVMLTLWFASSGGPADTAVTGAAALAQRQSSTPATEPATPSVSSTAPAPTATPASWFAPDDSDEPLPTVAPNPGNPGVEPHADPNAVYRAPPTGPDFPPSNR